MNFIEAWWIDRVKDFFASKPFNLKIDTGASINSAVKDLLNQAKKRQKDNPGTMYEGAVLQHLVGAKLQLLEDKQEIEHNGFTGSRCANRPERGFYCRKYNYTCSDCSGRIING